MEPEVCEFHHFLKGFNASSPVYRIVIQIALDVQDIPGCAGSNLSSPLDESSARAIKVLNLPNSSSSTHASVLEKGNAGDQI
ncbi:hypothetical protein HAX54_015100 [Datura stramonium]|uniref:Uncharacterized protein n=1 Tax=Datura stramonium TaxID=4076 RepID=A0ABS8TQ27_DATST|nr:hypothetical protein [Datura stramonium]